MPEKYTRGQKRLFRQVRAFHLGERDTPYWPQSYNMTQALEALERKGAIKVNHRTKTIWILDEDWKVEEPK